MQKSIYKTEVQVTITKGTSAQKIRDFTRTDNYIDSQKKHKITKQNITKYKKHVRQKRYASREHISKNDKRKQKCEA